MLKRFHIFGWEHEPVAERPSEFSRSSRFSDTPPVVGRAFSADTRRALSTNDPTAQRTPPSERDATLSAMVPIWLDTLPHDVHPHGLCASFPRIANRLALCWPDAELSLKLIGGLLADTRGGRKGFPRHIADELRALRTQALHRPHSQPNR